MSKRKYHVFFRRVSTKGQDLAMQIQADAPIREGLLTEEILIFDEDAVSANRVRMEDRKELLEVISLIKQGQVDTIYTFDQSRLFRDAYEGNYFNDLQNKYGFKVFFTKDNQLMSDNFLFAGMSVLMSDVEGKNIARRTAEARRMFPPQKFGYIKVKETKQYNQNPKVKDTLKHYFESLLAITNYEEMFQHLTEYSKKLNRQKEELIRYAGDPFYAGYDLSKGQNKLNHVDAYLDLEAFNSIQATSSALFDEYLNRREKLKSQNTFSPLCGYCYQPLLFYTDEDNNTSYYNCSRNHKRNRIDTSQLNEVVKMVLQETVNNLDTKSLLKQSRLFFSTTKVDVKNKIKTIERQQKRLNQHLLINQDYTNSWKENSDFQKLAELKEKEDNCLEELSLVDHHLLKNNKIVNVVNEYLSRQTNGDTLTSGLSPLFIDKIIVHNNQIDVEIYMSDYLKEMQSEFIYAGGASE